MAVETETPELKTLRETADAIKQGATEIKGLLATQAEEIKTYGKSTEETAKKLTAAEARWEQAGQDQKALMDKLTERIDEYELKAQRGRGGFGGDPTEDEKEAAKSLGERFAELMTANRDKVAAAYKMRTIQGLPVAEVKSIHGPTHEEKALLHALGQKALTTTETLNFIRPDWRPTIVPITYRKLRIRDMMNVIPTSAPSTAYLREYGFGIATGTSVTSITTASTVATATTAAAHGFKSGDYILISGATVAAFNGKKQITVTGATTYTYTIADQSNASASGTLLNSRMNNYGAADFVAEGSAKPEAKMRFEEVLSRIEVIAHFIKASRQVLDDAPSLRSQIDGRLVNGLRYKEESAILYGNGTSPQIQGLMTLSGTQSYAWSSSGVTTDTKLDAIRRSMTLIQNVEADDPTGCILNPFDWEDIETIKSSTGEYILMASPTPGTNPDDVRIWRLPLVVTNAMQSGDFAVGNFAMACALRDRQAANVRLADQHSDDFTNNLVTILAEERMNMEWYQPNAFVIGDFDSAPV